MEQELIEHLALLRAAVGFLGERGQCGCWGSSFFSPESEAFLSPIFPRTRVLAQYHGVIAAAARVHDERIGVGRVYHLFRLPEDVEERIHRALHEPELSRAIEARVATREDAFAFLREKAGAQSATGLGPTHLGPAETIASAKSWRSVAALYARGFEENSEIYPYFTDSE